MMTDRGRRDGAEAITASNACATVPVSPRCAACAAWSSSFSNGPCVLQSPVREVLEVNVTTCTIKKVVADRGFGFIAAEDAKEYFFHRGGLDSSLDFDRLVGGERVQFDVEASPKG